MKLTIVPVDGLVVKDGAGYIGLQLTGVPTNIHALQWDGLKGELEFVNDADGIKPVNEKITVLPSWANDCVAAWDACKAEEEAAIAAALAAQQNNQTLPQ